VRGGAEEPRNRAFQAECGAGLLRGCEGRGLLGAMVGSPGENGDIGAELLERFVDEGEWGFGGGVGRGEDGAAAEEDEGD